jgi:hypothetical protein
MNLALTCAKSVLWIIGNFDCWRHEFKVIAANKVTINWALFMVDLVMRGGIINMYDFDHTRTLIAVRIFSRMHR